MKTAKMTAFCVFGLFFLMNAALFAISLLVANDKVVPPMAEFGFAVQLLLLLVGMGLSWVIGRWIYGLLLDGTFEVNDSANAAWIILFSLILLFATISFLSTITWIWQGIILLVVILFAFIGLTRVFSILSTAAIIILGLLIAAAIYYFFG